MVKGIRERLAPLVEERTAPHRSGEDPKRRDVTACGQGWPRLTGSNHSTDNSPGGPLDVRFSIAASSSAPMRTITTESQIQVMKPTTAPKEP